MLYESGRNASTEWWYVEDLIKNAPTIEPKRKKRKRGKWINISDGIFEIVKCDQCGRTIDSRDNFCPRCGSDMTEDSE